jgi:hypothetical protein
MLQERLHHHLHVRLLNIQDQNALIHLLLLVLHHHHLETGVVLPEEEAALAAHLEAVDHQEEAGNFSDTHKR